MKKCTKKDCTTIKEKERFYKNHPYHCADCVYKSMLKSREKRKELLKSPAYVF